MAAAAAAAFAFTPLPSLLGGLTLGVQASSKLALTGRVLGISGTLKGVVIGRPSAWRLSFLAGLVAGGVALATFLPGAFEVLPPTYSFARAVAGGWLVGERVCACLLVPRVD